MSSVGRPDDGLSWRRRAVLGALIWFGLCAAGFALGARPQPLLLALAVTASGTALLLLVDTFAQTPRTTWTLRGDDLARAGETDARLGMVVRLVNGHLDARQPSNQLRDYLLQLVDARLMTHHGITMEAAPDRARALMPPELSQFVDDKPPHPRLTLAQISRLADRIGDL